MTQLVANESFQYYKMRLPNTYLISAKVYMSKSAYSILIRDLADEHLIRDAINENQFSTGAMNCLYEMLDQAFSPEKTPRNESLLKLKALVKKWLLTIDLEKAVIN